MEFLGVRVVRGPDWKWGNQDGGEGNVGTIVHIGTETKSPIKEPIVWVRWDSGSKANYRAGVDGKHDLRVLDSANADVRHIRVSCDGCKQDPIIGFRWHCKTCPNYDLCTQCYMTDSHDVGHQFERYDKSRGQGVAVGTRQGSTKLETRGLFKGAKVVRGCDWEWRDQDGGPNTEGVVKEITSWDDEATKDSVRVAWKKRKGTNIYRVGKHGKVDLKCTVPASGGSYYRDHLPLLIVKQEKSQSGFVTGDKVIVQLTSEQLQELSVGHGEWNADMAKFIGKVGVVHDFASNGDVLVDYPDKLWRYNPKALTKIQKFKRGDEILVKNDKKLVKELQEGHGGWNEALVSILGRIGKVLEVDGDGDLVVSVEGDHWVLNPAAVTYVTDPSPAQATADDGHSTDEPLGGLFHDFFRGLLQRAVVEGIGSHHLGAACKQNNLSRVREILDNHPESIDEMVGGHTALHIACHEGHCNVIRELIDRGADKDKVDSQGYSAMHHATFGDKTGEAVKFLLQKGFDPNVQQGENRSTPLHLAVKNNNEMAVRILTEHEGCDVNLQDQAGDTPLFDAIAGEKHVMADMLLNHPRLLLAVTNGNGFNYLHFAVLKGNKQAVEKLLAMGGSVLNVIKSDGFTTLHIAAINDHREIAKLLLEQPGCCVSALATHNQTPLHLAASEGYPVMAEILLSHGADVNAVDGDGDTPLHLTLAKELIFNTEMPGIHLLLTGRNGRSYAAVSRCLLSYGADVRRENNKSETPLDRCTGTEVEQAIRDIAAKGNSHATKTPTFTRGSSRSVHLHDELANEADLLCTELSVGENAAEDSEIVERKENAGDPSNQEGNQRGSGEIVDESQQEDEEQERGAQMMEVEDVQNNLVKTSAPCIVENVPLEVTNQGQEMSSVEVLNTRLNRTDFLMEVDVAHEDKSKMTDLGAGKIISDETEAKREVPSCRVCEDNEAIVAFKPCGHIVLCKECAPRLKRCLECQTRITGKCTKYGTPIIDVNNKSLAAKYQQLEGKIRKLEESILCCICVERKKNVVFLCGHGTCEYCAEQLKTCHICQKPIVKKIPIF